MDFINVDLSSQDVSGVNFTEANFTGANLSNTKFDGANLTGAILIGATLNGTSFNGAILDQAQFSNAERTTDLSQVNWGTIQSAKEVNFSGCTAKGTQLCGAGALIDCSGANFSGANFTGAILSYLNLTGADLTNLVATSASFNGACLQGAIAHGAVFSQAHFSNATLSNAQFGAKVLLFTLPESFHTELDNSNGKSIPQDIVAVFQQNKISLSSQATVTLQIAGQSWLISDGAAHFNVLNNATSTKLEVFTYGNNVSPATLVGADLYNTTCTGANFSSVTLSNVTWTFATADHVDLEGASLTNSLLLETNFTQARMFGTDLTDSILIQAKLKGAVLAPNFINTQPNLTGAQLQGADFTDAQIQSGNLEGAGVALEQGVPLFVISSNVSEYVTDLSNCKLTAGIKELFQQQSYSLGSGASIQPSSGWLIDNSMDTDPLAVKTFYVDLQYYVYDNSQPGTDLFQLPSGYTSFLNNPNPAPPLIAYFANSGSGTGYSLSAKAKISSISSSSWQIQNTQDANVSLPVIYRYITIYQKQDGLHVYGSASLWLKNFPKQTSDIAFSATAQIQQALSSQSICPNGQPKSSFDKGEYTWEQMMTVQVSNLELPKTKGAPI